MNKSELLKGTLGTIILQLLADNDRLYGYEITQMVKEKTDGKMLVKEGSLYPALHKLQADGLVVSEEVFVGKRVRKYYKLTQPGKTAAKASVDELMEFMQTICQLVMGEKNTGYVPAGR